MNFGVERARQLLTPAKRLCQINNNLCMYCEDANHYAVTCSKENWKTMLREIVVHGKEQSFSLKAPVKPSTLSISLSYSSS